MGILRQMLGWAKGTYAIVTAVLLLTMAFWTFGAAASANRGGDSRAQAGDTTTTTTGTTTTQTTSASTSTTETTTQTTPVATTGSTTTGTTSTGSTSSTTSGTTTAETTTTTTETAGRGHTPVTLCHREGNGSFHEITVDDDAVPAHLAHGDRLAGPAGCATTTTTTTGATTVGTTTAGATTTATTTAGVTTSGGGQAPPGCAFGNDRKNGQTATAPGCEQGGGNPGGNGGNGGNGGGGKKKGR